MKSVQKKSIANQLFMNIVILIQYYIVVHRGKAPVELAEDEPMELIKEDKQKGIRIEIHGVTESDERY